MRKKQFRTRLGLLIVLMLLLLTLAGNAVGKYVTTAEITGNVTFTARLAKNMELRESTITRNPDGSHSTTAETITEGTQPYVLLPGVDVPKDTHIVITGKTEIDAYLYLVVENAPAADSGLIYELEDWWQPLEGYSGVYVYSDGNKDAIPIDNGTRGLDNIGILKNDTIEVSQYVKHNTDLNLNFTAVMKEISDSTLTAEQVYGG